jgi:hypothetical protein
VQVLWGIATPSEIVRVSFIGTIYLAIADPKSGKDRTCFFSPLFFVDSTCYFRQVARVYRHEQPAGRPFSDGVHYQRRQARLRQCVRDLNVPLAVGVKCFRYVGNTPSSCPNDAQHSVTSAYPCEAFAYPTRWTSSASVCAPALSASNILFCVEWLQVPVF